MSTLKNKVIFITGASRGIGLTMAKRFAQDGAKIIVAAKTTEPHPNLKGTIFTAAAEIEAAGGQALPIAVDIRDEERVRAAMAEAAAHFGGIDILINNASAIKLKPTMELSMKEFDLMLNINLRGTYVCSVACLPYLQKAQKPAHILSLSPPLNLNPQWFKEHLAYTMAKYGMSMCTLGLATEYAGQGIYINSLWPTTIIATAAIANNFPSEFLQACRKPEIVADAAYLLLTADKPVTGQFLTDEQVLKQNGIINFAEYAVNPQATLQSDLFLN